MIFFYFYSLKKEGGMAFKFANFESIARIKGVDIFSRDINLFLLDVFLVVLVTFSLAGFSIYVNQNGSAYSYVIALDSSESMSATDLDPSRFDIAKTTAVSFIQTLSPNTNIGVVSFAENTILESPVITKKSELINSVNNIALTSVGGTDVFEAISISRFLLKPEQNRAIVLLSDGQVNTGNFNLAINNAVNDKIVIYTLGLGTNEGGNTTYGLSVIDEESLKLIAQRTGGKYFRINNAEDMKKAFNAIIDSVNRPVKIDLRLYLLMASIIFFILREFVIYFNRVAI